MSKDKKNKITKNPHKHLRKLGDYVNSLEARVEELEKSNKDLSKRLSCSILKYIDDACQGMKNKCKEINTHTQAPKPFLTTTQPSTIQQLKSTLKEMGDVWESETPAPLNWVSVEGLKKGEVYKELLVRDSEGGITIGKVEYSEVSEGGGNWFCVLDDGEEHWNNITHFATPSQYTSLHTTTNGAKEAEWIEVGELDESRIYFENIVRLDNGEIIAGHLIWSDYQKKWQTAILNDAFDKDAFYNATHILPLTHFPIQKMVDDLNNSLKEGEDGKL